VSNFDVRYTGMESISQSVRTSQRGRMILSVSGRRLTNILFIFACNDSNSYSRPRASTYFTTPTEGTAYPGSLHASVSTSYPSRHFIHLDIETPHRYAPKLQGQVPTDLMNTVLYRVDFVRVPKCKFRRGK
jgi:hypothetical protein